MERLFTKGLLLIVILFTLSNCQKEEFLVVTDFEKQFSLNDFKDEYLKTNLVVNWNDFHKIESSDGNTHYLFNTSFKSSTTIHSSNRDINFKYQIFACVDSNGIATFEILKFLANDDKSLEKISFFNTEFFSGTLYHYNLKSELLKMSAYRNGAELEKLTENNIKLMNQSKYAPIEDGWVLVRTEYWTDWYKAEGGGWIYLNSVLNNVSYEWVYVGGGISVEDSEYHIHSNSSGGGFSNPVDVHLMEITFDPSITPCLKNIINLLQQKDNHYSVVPSINDQNVSHISQAILDLFDASKEYSLNFSISQLGLDNNGNEINAETDKLTSGNGWEITIDTDLANNGTQLSIAKTIIHEAVHAYINYMLKTDRTSSMVSDLNKLYLNYLKFDNIAPNLTQHEFMSQFVDSFAFSLAAWDNHTQSMDYYKMLSWGGLETSTAYSLLTNKTEIQNAIQNERYNNTGAKGTKCN